MSVTVSRRLFSVDEYHEMADSGIFDEDDRVELLAGEVVEMTPIGSHHAACVNRLNQILNVSLQGRAIVSVQNPVRLNAYSEPQPDLALLKSREDFYASTHAEPRDILLIIEVADTSAEVDREIKIPLYAEAGIPEVWLVAIPTKVVEVYRNPSKTHYEVTEKYIHNQQLSIAAFPDVKVEPRAILG